MALNARVLYSKDPAHKKRKRWIDGFLSGKRLADDKIKLALLDESGNTLSRKNALKSFNDEDLCDEDSEVYKSFGGSGFQLQFDELCSSSDIPSALTETDKGNVEKKPKSYPNNEDNFYQKNGGASTENCPPTTISTNEQAFQGGVSKSRSFSRPRFQSNTPSGEDMIEGTSNTRRFQNGKRGCVPVQRFESVDDEILAFFQYQSQSSNDSLHNLIFQEEEEVKACSAGLGHPSTKIPSVSDWSKKMPKAQNGFHAPRSTEERSGHTSTSKSYEQDATKLDETIQFNGSKPFANLTFQLLKERKVLIPDAFSSIDEYKGTWIKALVEEVGLQLSQVKNKVLNWSKYGKGRKPAWLGHCRIAKFEKNHKRFRQSSSDDQSEPPKLFMNFDKRPCGKSSFYSMLDTWILGSDLESLITSVKYGCIVKSLWHGLSSDNKLQIEPLDKMPPLKESLVAIQGPNIQSEVQMLELFEKLGKEPAPLIQRIMNSAENKPDESRDTAEVELSKDLMDLFSLNDSQIQFMKKCRGQMENSSDGISILHGPFGSGKTTVIVALIMLLTRYSSGKSLRILVSANTNIAVDHILNGLVAKGFSDLVRIGSVKKIDPKLLKYTAHSKTDSSKEIISELKEMIRVASPADKVFYQEELSALQNSAKAKSSEKLKSAKVVGVTCHSSTNALLDDQKFDCIILDECSQIVEPLSMLPIVRSKANFLIAVGDPNQLPPVIASPANSRTRNPTMFRPLFSRLLQMGYNSTLLDTQYRCHPYIADIANKLFYGSRLRNGCDTSERESLVPGLPHIVFVDTRGSQERYGGSIWNKKEAKMCRSIFERLTRHGIASQDIGIICFFKEQVNRIRQELDSQACSDDGDGGGDGESQQSSKSVLVATVDSFQGNEKKVIILSTSVTSPGSFGSDPNRLNVALTRATTHLVIVGCAPALATQRVWANILSHVRSNAFGRMLAAGEPFPIT